MPLDAPWASATLYHEYEPQLGHSFLLPAPAKLKEIAYGSDFLTPTSFKEVVIQFTPKAKEIQEQELKTEDDLAIANRECEKEFGQSPDLEKPCKLAVVERYLGSAKTAEEGSGGSCFPADACVTTLNRGELRLADLHIGDLVETVELDVAVNDLKKPRCWTRVVAWLHQDPRSSVPYLRIQHTSGEISVSAAHLVCVKKDGCQEAEHSWIPAQDISPGSVLFMAHGKSCIVTSILPEERQGMYAPLTDAGTLLVDGVLCSCYAPPVFCQVPVPHMVCHVALAPLRALDQARRAVERWDIDENGRPLFTIEVVHPWIHDQFMHPYAAVLLRLAQGVASFPSQLFGLDAKVVSSAPILES
eukprot:gnl/MRDRNA2_/MRDRNA2_78991_c0_seq1.p1 gnl/MRDRNA2_/MRDRNA2_78991_c0~~gnl/MRDRNA2_/MRDRNA2_78991_c0_seq1.p1  ORF type:complete len:359 (-),score=57.88 gnl/MRDRNA2_/MRDRNA2_78991_c0_seq1:22-1098(-)